QSLHGFDGGTGEYRSLDIAGRGNHNSVRIDDDESPAMAVFNPVAAQGFSENRVGVHAKTPVLLLPRTAKGPAKSTCMGRRYAATTLSRHQRGWRSEDPARLRRKRLAIRPPPLPAAAKFRYPSHKPGSGNGN